MSFETEIFPELICHRYNGDDDGVLERRIYVHPKTGEYHREDGPAIQVYFLDGSIELQSFFINGVPHREDGAAIQWFNRNGNITVEEYYLHGEKLTERQFMQRLMEDAT